MPVRLESLERRTLFATFNPLAAAVDGAIGSLRAAVIAANANHQNGRSDSHKNRSPPR